MNMVYRGYRYPYDWVPQFERPEEISIEKIDIKNFRVPGAAVSGAMKVSIVEGVKEYEDKGAFCVISSSER